MHAVLDVCHRSDMLDALYHFVDCGVVIDDDVLSVAEASTGSASVKLARTVWTLGGRGLLRLINVQVQKL